MNLMQKTHRSKNIELKSEFHKGGGLFLLISLSYSAHGIKKMFNAGWMSKLYF